MFKIIYVFLCLSVLGNISCEKEDIVDALEYKDSLFSNEKHVFRIRKNNFLPSKKESIINYIWRYVCKQSVDTRRIANYKTVYSMLKKVKGSEIYQLLILALSRDPNAEKGLRDFEDIRDEVAEMSAAEEDKIAKEFSRNIGVLKFCPDSEEYVEEYNDLYEGREKQNIAGLMLGSASSSLRKVRANAHPVDMEE